MVLLAFKPEVFGQLSVNAFATPYNITFDGTMTGVNNGAFMGTGFQVTPSAGRLDANAWQVLGMSNGTVAFDVNNFTADATRGASNGGVNSGGIYGFATGSITGRALGFEPSGSDLTPGSITLKITNNSGADIPQLLVQYEIHVRNDQPRGNSLNFSHSPDNSSFWSEPSLDYISPQVAGASAFFLAATQVITLGCVNIPAGSDYYLRWETNDVNGSLNRDEFAIDNIQITASNTASITYYSRNSDFQTTNSGTTGQEWSTTRTGGVVATQFPLERCADYVVQNGHTVTLSGSGNVGLTINNLTVENGGSLVANGATNRYLNILGDITCDGNIGGAANGMSFNLEHGTHVISGSGSFDGGRLLKSNVNGMSATTNLLIDMDLDLHFAGSNMYNERTGSSIYNVTIAAGRTVNIHTLTTDGTNNAVAADAGGTLQVDGTLNVSSILRLYTNNTINPVSVHITSSGRINTNRLYQLLPSGAANSFLAIDPGGYLDITGTSSWSINLTNNNVTFDPGSTVEYSAAGAQTVPSVVSYGNIIFSGSGNKNLSGGDLTVVNDIDIQGSAILRPQTMDVFLQGNWTNYGQVGFLEAASTVTLNGTADQTIDGAGGEIYYQLVINKAGGDVLLNDELTATNNLDMQNGDLDLSGHTLSITTNVPTGITRTNGLILSDSDTNSESVYWTINGNPTNHVIPFGRPDGTYLPASFQVTSGNAGIVRVATYPTPPSNLNWPSNPVVVNNLFGDGGVVDNWAATVDRFWHVTAATGSTMDMALSYAVDELPGAPYNTPMSIEAQRYNRTTDKWEPALPLQTKTAITGAWEVLVPGVTPYDLTPWTFAPVAQPLPIELLYFHARPDNNEVRLEWSTASETDNDFFTLERGLDGLEFQAIGTVNGAGNSNSQLDYTHFDERPFSGISYYRLKQTDYDGTFTYSDVKAVDMGWNTGTEITVWANDNGLQINHGANGHVVLELHDVLGRHLYSSEMAVEPGTEIIQLPLNVSKGQVLILSMRQNNGVESVRFFY